LPKERKEMQRRDLFKFFGLFSFLSFIPNKLFAFGKKKKLPISNRCLQCGGHHTAEIIYGYPDVNYFSRLPSEKHKRTYLGGCVIEKENHICLDCNNKWV